MAGKKRKSKKTHSKSSKPQITPFNDAARAVIETFKVTLDPSALPKLLPALPEQMVVDLRDQINQAQLTTMQLDFFKRLKFPSVLLNACISTVTMEKDNKEQEWPHFHAFEFIPLSPDSALLQDAAHLKYVIAQLRLNEKLIDPLSIAPDAVAAANQTREGAFIFFCQLLNNNAKELYKSKKDIFQAYVENVDNNIMFYLLPTSEFFRLVDSNSKWKSLVNAVFTRIILHSAAFYEINSKIEEVINFYKTTLAKVIGIIPSPPENLKTELTALTLTRELTDNYFYFHNRFAHSSNSEVMLFDYDEENCGFISGENYGKLLGAFLTERKHFFDELLCKHSLLNSMPTMKAETIEALRNFTIKVTQALFTQKKLDEYYIALQQTETTLSLYLTNMEEELASSTYLQDDKNEQKKYESLLKQWGVLKIQISELQTIIEEQLGVNNISTVYQLMESRKGPSTTDTAKMTCTTADASTIKLFCEFGDNSKELSKQSESYIQGIINLQVDLANMRARYNKGFNKSTRGPGFFEPDTSTPPCDKNITTFLHGLLTVDNTIPIINSAGHHYFYLDEKSLQEQGCLPDRIQQIKNMNIQFTGSTGSGLKHLGLGHNSVRCNVYNADGATKLQINSHINYELKFSDSPERILLLTFAANNNPRIQLFIGTIYLPQGLHTTANKKSLETILNTRSITIYLPEMNNQESQQNSSLSSSI